MTSTTEQDLFKEWYSISGSIYTDEQTSWYIWQTIIAFLSKVNEDFQDKESKDQ